ncbi:MAG TPA: HAD family phosphatase [Candidatus Blautia faecipullorum]|nr:HAD family phosphatase [Candidatus Blautia faecipullorum]
MKKWKRFAALAAVIFLAAVFCLPMVFALAGIRTGEFYQGLFLASLYGVLFAAVMGYAIWMIYRLLNKKGREKEGDNVIKNVIFDVGRVLVAFNWEEYLRDYGFSEEKYQKIAEATFLSSVWPERDRGLYEEEEYIRRFAALAPEYEEDIRKVVRESTKTIQPYSYAETWAAYLKEQGYRLYILSNYSDYMLKGTIDKLTFLKYMDGIVFSCEVKELKPEPAIYQVLMEKYGLKPQECVFIDDMEENCASAEKLGIHAVCFRDFKQAAKDLEKLGVK